MIGKELLNKASYLNAELSEFKNPVLTDISLLGVIQEYILENTTEEERKIAMRYYLTVIAVTLYSPRCFVGQIMQNGLCRAIARTLGVKSHTTISQAFTTASTWLNHDKEFRGTVERLHSIISEKLSK